VAKKLLEKFGSLNAILHAHQDSLINIGGIGIKTVGFLKCLTKITNLLLQEEVTREQSLPMSVEKIAKYAIFSIGHLNYEKVMIFIFDSKKHFIKEYFHSKGTLSYSPMYIRELLVEILNTRASFIIMVHNHPSGNTYPSSADIEMTKKVTNLLNETDICLYDHLIVSNSSYTSMKRLGLF
jgi:DNA repair protein RadC